MAKPSLLLDIGFADVAKASLLLDIGSYCCPILFWILHPNLARYHILMYIVSVLGRNKGYTVKYTPLAEGVPEGNPEGTPEADGVYLIVYTDSSPNMDSI